MADGLGGNKLDAEAPIEMTPSPHSARRQLEGMGASSRVSTAGALLDDVDAIGR